MKKILLIVLTLFNYNNLFAQDDDWGSYGKDSGGKILLDTNKLVNEQYVKNLEKAWVHRSGDFHEGANWKKGINSSLQTTFQATPILVDETLYYCTPYNRVFALNSETGEEKWVFDPQIELDGRALLHCRGVSSWKDNLKSKDDKCYHRIIATTIDAELFSIDGKTGKLCDDFGNNGRVNLRKGLGDHNPAHYFSSSPPAIINNKIIVGMGADNISIDELIRRNYTLLVETCFDSSSK